MNVSDGTERVKGYDACIDPTMKDLKLDFKCLSIITIKLHSQIISFFIVVLHHFTITITHTISIIIQQDRGGKGSKFNCKQCGNSVVIRIVIAQ